MLVVSSELWLYIAAITKTIFENTSYSLYIVINACVIHSIIMHFHVLHIRTDFHGYLCNFHPQRVLFLVRYDWDAVGGVCLRTLREEGKKVKTA